MSKVTGTANAAKKRAKTVRADTKDYPQNKSGHQISHDLLTKRESKYELVDIIDHLFDTAID